MAVGKKLIACALVDNNVFSLSTGPDIEAFEQVASEILWREEFWVRTSVKVELTREDKKAIDLPSSPRWELDIVAYRPPDNSLRVVERKSYLDNPGVGARWLDGADAKAAGRFKLFSNRNS